MKKPKYAVKKYKADKDELKSNAKKSEGLERNIDEDTNGFRIFSSGIFKNPDRTTKNNKKDISENRSNVKKDDEEKVLEINVININSASEQEIASLPGVGVILAKKAMKIRGEKGSFESVEFFAKEVGINSRVFQRIKVLIKVD